MKHIPASKRVRLSAVEYKMFVNGEFNTAIPHHFNFATMARDKRTCKTSIDLPNITLIENY